MRAKRVRLWAFMGFILLTFLCSLPAALAETYEYSREDGNWKVSWNLEAPESFQDKLYQVQYVQQKADAKPLNEQLSPLLGEGRLTVDRHSPSHLYLDSPMMLSVPTFVSWEALPSASERAVMDSLVQGLVRCGFPCYAHPYACATLDTLRCDFNDTGMGEVYDWASYQRMICNENQSAQPEKNDLLVVFAPEINGCPIVPKLIGNFKESDVPMFALALIRDDTVRYFEMGCAYKIKKEKLIEAAPVDWKAAVADAAAYSERQYRPAFDSMAAEQSPEWDYPSFFAAYRPFFELEVKRIRACYYGNGKVLRPAYQIDMTLTVHLENAEALTEAERHHYLPEVIRMSYVVDAITGETVQVQ